MTNIEYMTEKNEIVFTYTGIVLIPKDQMVDLPITVDMVDSMRKYLANVNIKWESILNGNNCTYCKEYYNRYTNSCDGCPMHEAGNTCDKDNSTFYKVNSVIANKLCDTGELAKELQYLAREFINGNKDIKG